MRDGYLHCWVVLPAVKSQKLCGPQVEAWLLEPQAVMSTPEAPQAGTTAPLAS
jgi:hypothetical protein